jgi:RNA polymerase sigma factor (sigma-70 family)
MIPAREETAMSAAEKPENRDQLMAQLDARFRGPLMVYFLRRVRHHGEAEDLTQETFVRLLGSGTFQQADQAHAYVFRVASNLLRDRARMAVRRRWSPGGFLDWSRSDEQSLEVSEDREPERVLIGRERLQEVLEALDELGERTKNVFLLFRLEGMKQKEIAALYGMGLSTVEKHVIAATFHLAKRFGPKKP